MQQTEREVLWTPWTKPGLEHLRLASGDDGFTADSLLIGVTDEQPFRVHYRILGDAQWRVREVRMSLLDDPRRELWLRADGEGHWTTGDGVSLPALDGCIDIDISATPFTNTLPIRRLGLRPGASAEFPVVFISVPALRCEDANHAHGLQRYTCVEARTDGGVYRFDSLRSGFTVALPTDVDGLVRDYPELFRRVRNGESG